MIGVPKNEVILESHCEEWTAEFKKIKRRLENIHRENAVDIQHVGSTAIPGIVAKPLIDVALLLKRVTAASFDAMIQNGYIYYGEVAEGKYLFILKGENALSLQHIHCYGKENCALFYEQLRFRDFLCSHPEYAREYESLKLRLCGLYAKDRKRYTEGKQPFFDKIKNLASQDEQFNR